MQDIKKRYPEIIVKLYFFPKKKNTIKTIGRNSKRYNRLLNNIWTIIKKMRMNTVIVYKTSIKNVKVFSLIPAFFIKWIFSCPQ